MNDTKMTASKVTVSALDRSALILLAACARHSQACDGGYSVVGGPAATAAVDAILPYLTTFADPMAAAAARNDALEDAALIVEDQCRVDGIAEIPAHELAELIRDAKAKP